MAEAVETDKENKDISSESNDVLEAKHVDRGGSTVTEEETQAVVDAIVEKDKELIDRASSVYVVMFLFGSLLYIMTQLLLAITGNSVWAEVAYLSAQGSYSSMITSTFLAPKNEKRRYKALLFLQGSACLVLPDFIQVAFIDSSTAAWGKAIVRILFGLALFVFGLNVRKQVAKLNPERLSRFLTDDLLIPAFSTLAVFIFLALDPIRCWAEHPRNRNICERTLIGQAGLGFIVVIHFGTTLVNSTFPEAVKKHHAVTIHMIATGRLSLRKKVTMGVNIIALCCTFFLFAQYNARAGANEGERAVLFRCGLVGALMILFVGLWEWKVMQKPLETVDETNTLPPVLKLNRGFQVVGMTFTTLYSVLGFIQSATLNTAFGSVMSIIFPFTLLLFVVALITDPRSKSVRFEAAAFVSFIMSEVAAFIFALRMENTNAAYQSIGQFLTWWVAFYFALSARKKVASLGDAQLSTFFLDSVLKNIISNIAGMLFVTFRAVNCVMESRSLAKCSNTLLSGLYLSSYLAVLVGIKMVIGAMSERQKRDHAVSWEKIATMTNVKLRHKFVGGLLFLVGFCSMFLFCLLETETEEGKDESLATTVAVLGLVGTFAVIVAILSETLVLMRDSGGGEDLEEEDPIIVTEVATFWVALSVVLTLCYQAMYVGYAINPLGYWGEYADLVLPIVGLSFVMSIVMKPLRHDRKYKVFVLCHFTQFAVCSEILGFVGNARLGKVGPAIFNLVRIPIYCLGLKFVFRLRTTIAKLPPRDLSGFLVQSLFVRCSTCLATIAFFLFESITCWLEESDDSLCKNTSTAALYLSIIILVATLTSVIRRSAQEEVRREFSMSKERLACFDLDAREKLELVCLMVTAAASLILLSSLGVSSEPNPANTYTGMIGFASFTIIFIIEIRTLLQAEERRSSGGGSFASKGRLRRGSRSMSSSNISKSSRFMDFV